jgi:signal peptidase II
LRSGRVGGGFVNKYRLVCGVALVVLVLDQATKWWIQQTVSLYESIPVIDSIFHITHVRNTGGAFGLFRDAGEAFRVPFFLVVSVVAVGVLIAFVRRVPPEQRLLLAALGAIVGGACGNFIDRVVAGAVTDFLDFQIRGYHWPAFNVADSGITVGMVILLAYSFFFEERQETSANA